MIYDDEYKIREWLISKNYFMDCPFSYLLKQDSIEISIDDILTKENFAGSIQQIRKIHLKCTNPLIIPHTKTTFQNQIELGKICQLLPFESIIGLNVSPWGPKGFYIKCDQIEISESEIIERIVSPEYDLKSISITISKDLIPSGLFWLERLEQLGSPSQFIGYFGELIDNCDIQKDLYIGCSIKPQNRKLEYEYLGIKFCGEELENGYFKLGISLENSELEKDYWLNILSIIKSINFIEIQMGNVILSKTEWIDFYDNKELPERMKN